MKSQIFLIFMILAPMAQASSLKLQVSDPKGSYVLESEALRWKLVGAGRALSIQEKTCGKAVWESFRGRIDITLTSNFIQLPPPSKKTKSKKKIEAFHFEYNGKSFRVPAYGETARFLRELPQEFVITQTQENIFCQRTATK